MAVSRNGEGLRGGGGTLYPENAAGVQAGALGADARIMV